MPSRTPCGPARGRASPDRRRPHGAARSASRSAATRAARSIELTASGGAALTRRASLRQADDKRVPQRQHAMDARLETPSAVEAAALEEPAGTRVRLIDQAIHLAEVGAGGAELNVGDQQADLGQL